MAPKRKLKNDKKNKDEPISDEKATKKPRTDITTAEAKINSNATGNFKVMSWNVDGLRAWVKKDGLSAVKEENPDIVCFQELKCTESKLPPEFTRMKEDYHCYIFSAKKEGYSGVALLSKEKPISVKKGLDDPTHDDEGRCITAEFEQFYLVTAYVPNAGKKLVTLDKRMDWDKKLEKHLKELDAKKPLIYCGDLNVAHKEIDLKNPKTNKKNAGFTQEERDGFSHLLEQGFVDSFRELYPDLKDQYTFWTYMMNARSKNVGWRLDYFVLSRRLLTNLVDNVILSSIMGSDHCPIKLIMNFEE